MLRTKECVAMLLAGGEGRRLGFLTRYIAKPALPFGGKYRIIDFSLSNCTNSGIDTVGVLSQYQPYILNKHVGTGAHWDLDRTFGGLSILPPFMKFKGGEWYKGTANAVHQNFFFIEQFDPEVVLVISGDHVYKMDYTEMINYHKEKKADVTIGGIEVPWKEAGRFGIINYGESGQIVEFQEKPEKPKTKMASMGVYVFNTGVLKKYLKKDERDPESHNDFGKNVLPLMLKEKCRMYTYPFNGYWRDIGTVEGFWEAHMDLLSDNPVLDLYDRNWRIYTANLHQPAHYVAASSEVKNSMISEGCVVLGNVSRSVLFPGVYVGEGAVIEDAIIMPNAKIGTNVKIDTAIIDENSEIGDECRVCSRKGDDREIVIIKENVTIPGGTSIQDNSYFEE